MHLGSTLALAVRRLLRRPVRSLLLLQGTVWGVAVAIFPSAVIQGTREAALTRGASIGADRISLTSDPTTATPVALTRDDVARARAAVEATGVPVQASGGARVLGLPAREGDSSPPGSAALLAADPGALEARNLRIVRGRGLDPGDGPEACVVEAGVAAWLGRTDLAPGDRLSLPGVPGDLAVVGVTAPQGPEVRRTNDLGFDLTHRLYAGVAQRFLHSVGVPLVQDDWKRSDRCVWVLPRDETVDWIFLRVPPAEVTSAARSATAAIARAGRAVISLHALTFPLLLGKTVDRFLAVDAALFLACLVMGAVVMANLGLLTVLRRTREIAIRRVEGATTRDIAAQFLLEGLLLAAAGALLGVVLGIGLAELRVALEPVTGFTWRFPTFQAVVACGVALVIGLLASLLPALRAAALDPVDGLADE